MDSKGTDTPLAVAINGPWGSGKTSLAEMAEGRLRFGSDWDSDHVICKFDAWANDDAPHLGAAFAATVAKVVNRERHWWTRLESPLPSVMLTPEQRWWRRLRLWFLTVVLAAAAVFWSTRDSLLASVLHADKTVSSVGHGATATRLALPTLAVALILLVQLVQKLGPGVQTVARWIDDPKSEAAHGSMQDASQQLGKLIKQALRGKRRLMIFVDNLERCRPPRAVEVCEVVSQLIGHKDVVTVMIGDIDTIALSAEIKYAALETVSLGTPGSTGNASAGAYGRAYMEKLIQIQLRLPPPLPSGLQAMIKPPAGEPPAFPGRTADRGFAAWIREKAAVLLAPNRGALAFGSAFAFATIATIATFGADTLVLIAGLVRLSQPELAGQRGWCERSGWCPGWWERLGTGHDRLSAGGVLAGAEYKWT